MFFSLLLHFGVAICLNGRPIIPVRIEDRTGVGAERLSVKLVQSAEEMAGDETGVYRPMHADGLLQNESTAIGYLGSSRGASPETINAKHDVRPLPERRVIHTISDDPDKNYVLDELDFAPSPLGEVVITWSSRTGIGRKQLGVFTVLINTVGEVTSVVPDAHSLLPGMERAVISTFMQAKFTPGMRKGLPVNTALRIEVAFEPVFGQSGTEVTTKTIR